MLEKCLFQLRMELVLGKNAHVFFMEEKHFLRFSLIFNSQTVYYIYVTDKNQNKNNHLHVMYTKCGVKQLTLNGHITTLKS